MKERPIIFNTEMVRAILDGRKTQTRRVIKNQPILSPWDCVPANAENGQIFFYKKSELFVEQESVGIYHNMGSRTFSDKHCPYGQPGDRLWVREALFNDGDLSWMYFDGTYVSNYGNDGNYPDSGWTKRNAHRGTIPSIHMPRWASRILLEITDIRVERIQDIGPDDIMAEGRSPSISDDEDYSFGTEWFMDLWNSINAKRGYGWDVNPWVWVIEFKKI